jgi:hypothetical protein
MAPSRNHFRDGQADKSHHHKSNRHYDPGKLRVHSRYPPWAWVADGVLLLHYL